jgi:hypothetical protein
VLLPVARIPAVCQVSMIWMSPASTKNTRQHCRGEAEVAVPHVPRDGTIDFGGEEIGGLGHEFGWEVAGFGTEGPYDGDVEQSGVRRRLSRTSSQI